MLLKKNKNKIFFVHIPRTGGRYVTNLFMRNGFDFLFCDEFSFFKGINQRHLHHNYLKNFSVYKNNKKLAIIRDPLNRFISAASVDMDTNRDKHKFKLNTVDNVIEYIKFQQERYSYSTNWFRPQHEFISDDCFIWRYEDSFKKNFNNFIYKNFKVDLIVDEKISPWKVYYDYCPKIKITKVIEKAVKMVYEKDYQITIDFY
jgi:hypothetical protein